MKSIGNGINEGKIKFIFFFLIVLKDNWIFKAIKVTMWCVFTAYVKVNKWQW